MPERKLSQADWSDLRKACEEWDRSSSPKSITRSDGIGNREYPGWTGQRLLHKKGEIAAWKGIAESTMYAMRRGGWQLRRGIPEEDKPQTTVPIETFEAWKDSSRWLMESYQSMMSDLNRRIVELEAEIENLRRNQ